jgi:lipid-binding SYLF domain-containing protein
MRHSFQRIAVYALGLTLSLTPAAWAQTAKSPAKNTKEIKRAAEQSQKAARVFNEIMSVPDKAVPKDLLNKAEAVAVFPSVLKAGLIVGGRGGRGVISRRTANGCPQIGASSTDFILLFMNEGALKGLLEDKFEMGGEASIAAGPVGRDVAASTNLTLDAQILSYSRSRGAFAGLELKGVVISPDNDLNQAVYGMKARDLLMGAQKVSATQIPAGVDAFPTTLARYSKR